LSKKILPLISKIIVWCETPIILSLNLCAATRVQNKIYFSDVTKICKINIENFEIIKEENEMFKAYIMSSNDNYICVTDKEIIYVYSLDLKLKSKIKYRLIQGLAIDNDNNILISTMGEFRIYDIEGKNINSWYLKDNDYDIEHRNIAVNNNEIFMIDSAYGDVCVFSYGGKKLDHGINMEMNILVYLLELQLIEILFILLILKNVY
jgi:hypothetical protein